MPKTGIVVDSTCDLGPRWLESNNVSMVPLKVLFGDQTFLDGIDLEPAEFYRKLVSSPVLPKTSQPSPLEFAEVYKALASEGCTEIVSIHLSSAISGTFESATMAAGDSPIPVRLVDTRSVTQAAGLIVKAAVAARDAGVDSAAIEAVAKSVSSSTRMFFVPDTLEYLVKGGRAGKAQGLAASLLNIKPILTFNAEGIIEPFKKVKGMKKALSELTAQILRDSQEKGRLRLIVFHAAAPELAEELRSMVIDSGADCDLDPIDWVGSVIGTYGGPNAVGCAYHPMS